MASGRSSPCATAIAEAENGGGSVTARTEPGGIRGAVRCLNLAYVWGTVQRDDQRRGRKPARRPREGVAAPGLLAWGVHSIRAPREGAVPTVWRTATGPNCRSPDAGLASRSPVAARTHP